MATDAKPKAPEAAGEKDPKKTVNICTGSKEVGEGKDRRFVASFVEISNESELREDLFTKGPVVSEVDGANVYVTVDAKKLRFHPKTGALISWK